MRSVTIQPTIMGNYKYTITEDDKVINTGLADSISRALEAVNTLEQEIKIKETMCWKDYSIESPVFLTGKIPDTPEYKHRWNVCKKNKNGTTHFVIASFWWNEREPCWEFESVGTRFLEYYTEGLNEWVLSVMDTLKEMHNDFEVNE